MSIFKMKFFFNPSKALYFHYRWIFDQYISNLLFYSSILIFELNQMNSDKISVLQYSYLSILWKYLDKKMEIFKECHCLYQYYYEIFAY